MDVESGTSTSTGGRVVSGIGVGAISAVAPAYVSEFSPKNVRGRITFQIMVAIGVMLSLLAVGISQHNPLAVGLLESMADPPSASNSSRARRYHIMAIGASSSYYASLPAVPRLPRPQHIRTKPSSINLSLFYRKEHVDAESVRNEMAEIEEERRRYRRSGRQLHPQWAGQNSVGCYAPQIFTSVYRLHRRDELPPRLRDLRRRRQSRRYTLQPSSSSIFFLVESLARPAPLSLSLIISSIGMGTLFFIFFIIATAILKTHPPPSTTTVPEGFTPPPTSKAMSVAILMLPETKGRSLEEMDIIFGAVRAEDRDAKIKQTQKAMEGEGDMLDATSTDSVEHKA
ncbi:hypothetical protein SCHPADRAFT_946344 [Schizopora paradoxa]|uniref:Major facilitator superfamily (MFS) profile domain-containing protein n=1 Tax=Schizopora paradoxa TaxID=27342 RepID=A0A0H2R476_9AGAM|nr:hypothetical protein SCHPADRAFT_946344 [Schizopora paradoxa]